MLYVIADKSIYSVLRPEDIMLTDLRIILFSML